MSHATPRVGLRYFQFLKIIIMKWKDGGKQKALMRMKYGAQNLVIVSQIYARVPFFSYIENLARSEIRNESRSSGWLLIIRKPQAVLPFHFLCLFYIWRRPGFSFFMKVKVLFWCPLLVRWLMVKALKGSGFYVSKDPTNKAFPFKFEVGTNYWASPLFLHRILFRKPNFLSSAK